MRVPRALARVAKADRGHRCAENAHQVNVGTVELEVSPENAHAHQAYPAEHMDHYHKAVQEEG
eukprot:15456323-Alexandrium_andersonii.AAC.1